MYQIIYIDIDEEITSVIDKLRKVKTTEVFLAIPKRALILQSIMSLKLLFREAERSEKHMVVVTQDPQEKKTVEKAGIETRNSLEGLDTEGEMRESVVPKIQEENTHVRKAPARKNVQRKSMEEIGSNEFYDIAVGGNIREKRESFRENLDFKESPRRMMTEISREKGGARKANGAQAESLSTDLFRSSGSSSRFEETDQIEEGNQENSTKQIFEEVQSREEMLGNFFEPKASDTEKKTSYKPAPKKQIPISGKLKKAIFIILFSGLLVAGGALAYLFVPKAEVRVVTKSQSMEKDLTLSGSGEVAGVDIQGSILPVRLVEKEMTYAFSYPVTGKSTSVGKKAKGTVVIYNEFSSSPQSLVATTRLETSDKKIFRLTKGVTVPGTNEVNGEIVPGAIEAEVIADASGEEYNIDPTTFSIPGFAGSAKFNKFSAKSSNKMLGGSSLSQGDGGVASLTQTDVAIAKSKAEAQVKDKIKEDLKNDLADGEMFFESVTEEEILESLSLSKAGDVVSEFQYRVKIKSQALVFLEADVKRLFLNAFKVPDDADNQSQVILDYGVVSGDLSNKTMNIKAHGKFSSSAELDSEKLKSDLAGKNGAEIEELIKSYPQIDEIEINISPAFLFEKVPQITSRIEILVAN